jgi:hypothetical protein
MSGKPKHKGKVKPEQPSASAAPGSGTLPHILSGFAIITGSIALLSRIFLAGYPLNRDEGTYGYLGSLAAKGLIPYIDFYEMKPPMLYYLYGLGGSLFGFTDFGLRFFGLLLNLASALLIFLVLKRYIQKPYALVSGALFAMMSVNLFALGFTMVAEHIVNAFLLLSIYLLHKSYEDKGILNVILAGAAFAIAILTKQTAILFAPLFIAYLVMQRDKKTWLTHGLYFAAGALAPALLVLLFLWTNGALDDAYYWLMTYPARYSSSITLKDGIGFFNYFLGHITSFQVSLFLLSGLALMGNLIFPKQRPNFLLLLYFLLAAVALIPGLRFYGQYWLLIMVPLAMMTGTAIQMLDRKNHLLGMASAFVLLVCILGESAIHADYYFKAKETPEMENLYRNNPFGPIRKLSTYAASILKDNETIMMLGSEPQVYLYTGRTAPSRHIFMSMLSKETDKSASFISEAMNDLREKKPDYILYNLFPFSWSLVAASNTELYTSSYKFVVDQYTPVAAYNMNDQRYIYEGEGTIDPKVINQVILFKRK